MVGSVMPYRKRLLCPDHLVTAGVGKTGYCVHGESLQYHEPEDQMRNGLYLQHASLTEKQLNFC